MVNTMENAEEVMQILDRFTRLKQKEIPKELDDYLQYVAKTGDTIFKWSSLKYLFREKLLNVIKHFHDTTPRVDEIPQYPNVDPFNYESMKASLLERLELFNAAPFTIQRLCELLIDPRKQYSRIDKFMRALEKNILVVSTVEPGRKRTESENGDSLDSVVNGDLSLDVNVDIDMENDGLFALEAQNGNGTVPAAVTAAVEVLPEVKDKLTSPPIVENANSTARTGDDDILPHPKKAKLELNDNEPKSEVPVEQKPQHVEKIVVEAKNGTEPLKPENAADVLEAETKHVEQNNGIKIEESNGNISETASKETAELKPNDIEMTTKEEKPVDEVKTEESAVKKDEVNDKTETVLAQKTEQNKKIEDKNETPAVKEVKENSAENEKIEEECKKTTVDDVAQAKLKKEVEAKAKPVEDKVDREVAVSIAIVVEQEKVLKLGDETFAVAAKVETTVEEKEKTEILPKQEEKEKVVDVDNKLTENVVLENGSSSAVESPAEVVPEVTVEVNSTKVEEKTDEIAKTVVKDSKIETETKVEEEEVKEKTTEKIEQKEEKKIEAVETTKSSSIINEEKTEKAEEVTETAATTVETSQTVEPTQAAVVEKATLIEENKTEGQQSAKTVVEDVQIEKSDTTAAIAAAEIVAVLPAAVIEEPMPIEADSPLVAGIDIDELPAIAAAAAALVEPLPETSAAESIIAPTLALNDQPMEDLPMEETAPEEVIMADSVVASGLAGLVEMTTDAMEATSKDEPAVDGMDIDDTSQEAMDQ